MPKKIRKYHRKARKGEIPDVAESVEYEGTYWRVTSYYKRQPNYIWNLVPCVREEAELIGMYAVCGAIVKPSDVKRSYKIVPWSIEWIREARESVNRRAADDDFFCQS